MFLKIGNCIGFKLIKPFGGRCNDIIRLGCLEKALGENKDHQDQ